jgi:hypothetical protein
MHEREGGKRMERSQHLFPWLRFGITPDGQLELINYEAV